MSISAHKKRKVGQGTARFRKPMDQVIAETPNAVRDLAPDSSEYAVGWALFDYRCHCSWPLGDPRSADFKFCGAPRVNAAYCERHSKMAYRPAPSRS